MKQSSRQLHSMHGQQALSRACTICLAKILDCQCIHNISLHIVTHSSLQTGTSTHLIHTSMHNQVCSGSRACRVHGSLAVAECTCILSMKLLGVPCSDDRTTTRRRRFGDSESDQHHDRVEQHLHVCFETPLPLACTDLTAEAVGWGRWWRWCVHTRTLLRCQSCGLCSPGALSLQ